jgi:hypothetical protein
MVAFVGSSKTKGALTVFKFSIPIPDELIPISLISMIESSNSYEISRRSSPNTSFPGVPDWSSVNGAMKALLTLSVPSDSVIVAPGGPTVTEDITVDIVAENLSSEIAFMLAIDEIQVGDIELGSILNMDQVLSCMLSTLYTPIEITRFTAEAETINHPTLTGFISPGIDRVVSAASEAAFDMYDVSFKKAMPGLFDFTIRNSLNNFTSDYLDNQENVACKEAPESSKDGNVDFRDLLLTPAESLLVGGSGDMRYGDVLPALYEVLMEFLNSTD